MTLDEAIEHCRVKEDCSLCGQEHKQLREWLEDYKRMLQERSQDQLLGTTVCGTDGRLFDPVWGMYVDEFEDWDNRAIYESIRKDGCMKEIAIKCTLYFDLLKNESADDAIERLQETLNENEIAAQFYEHEVRDIGV